MGDHANMKFHEGTYARVIGMLKWGTVACMLIAAFVIWLIV